MIEIEEVTKQFGRLAAVNRLSLTIPDNSMFGLLGTNGAGKSTLLRMLAGVIKQDSGTITIDGEVQTKKTGRIYGKQKIFFLSDDQYFFPNATPVSMAGFYESMYPLFDKQRFFQMLNAFELPPDKKIHSFSKGMKKQVIILLGICTGTEYLLCDEVFDGLDPVIRNSIKKLLEKEMKMRRLTILAASHNLRDLEDMCHTIGILHKGGVLLARDLYEMQTKRIKLQCVFSKDEEEKCSYSKRKAELSRRLNMTAYEKQGFVVTFIAKGDRKEICQAVEELHPLQYEIIPMSMEEIFMSETEAVGYDIHSIIS